MPNPPVSDDNLLGPYRLLRRLGQGGMGVVYLAHDDALMRHVAIKVLHPGTETSPQNSTALVKRFMREAQSAARLNHPHVVTVYHVGKQGDRPFIVMEYVDGGSLADELQRRGPLSWRQATLAIRDALLALSAAHDAAVIHRDIKPPNLMRASNGNVKLVDFGLARILSAPASGDLTFPGAFVGSPNYASPEQAVGAAMIDARSDLYSLAATWYALITGQPPFIHDDPDQVMQQHLMTPFPDIRNLAPSVPAALVAAIGRASMKKPRDRYADARDMLAAVEEILALSAGEVSIPAASATALSSAHHQLSDLQDRLTIARSRADSSAELTALRGLYSLFAQLDRPDDARRVFREALVLHVSMSAPPLGAARPIRS